MAVAPSRMSCVSISSAAASTLAERFASAAFAFSCSTAQASYSATLMSLQTHYRKHEFTLYQIYLYNLHCAPSYTAVLVFELALDLRHSNSVSPSELV